MSNEKDLRYPIGKVEDQFFSNKGAYDEKVRAAHLHDIQMCPSLLEQAISNLDEHQLNTPYREGGWTSKQVIHHVADSHMNAYIRFKLALTEDEPVVKPYMEDRWAQLPDAQSTPAEVSLALLDSLHDRFVRTLLAIKPEEWKRTFRHPELGVMPLDKNLALYSWHGRHHVAHITPLRERMGW